MRVLFIALLCALTSPVHAQESGFKQAPLVVVNARMDAYNRHDLQAFMATYAESIRIYTYPDTALGVPGKEHIESIFAPLFAEGQVSVRIHQQIAQGNYVVNEETVRYADDEQRYVSVYEVRDGLIHSVRFIRD